MLKFLLKKLKNKHILLMTLALFSLLCHADEMFIEPELVEVEIELEGVFEYGIQQDPTFTFDPKRWGIVEGTVTDEVALKNKEILNSIIKKTKEIGITTFKIGAMDAYFKVDVNKIGRIENSEGSIQIPSDFHLEMSDDTFIRVQPNGKATYTLMTTYLTDNTTISGGNLVGDRFEHDYSPVYDAAGVDRKSHGWGHLLWIIASHDVIIDNVNLSKASGDGLVFHAKNLRNADGSLQSDNREVNNVLIKNTTIDECRRNGISILDGRNITFDNCVVINTGQGSQAYDSSGNKIVSSSGTAPMKGLDMEAIRYRHEDNSLDKSALIENIIVRNSRFTGNEKGDIVVFTANDVIIENNYFDKTVGNFASYNVKVRNNTFESRDPSFFAIGVQSFKDLLGNELNHSYEVTNNIIKGYGIGIKAAGREHQFTNNTITDCTTGILLISDLTDSTFSGNTITSTLSLSFGYKNLIRSQNINDVTISNETINVMNRPININNLLSESNLNESQINFKNCSLNTSNKNFKNLVKNAKNIKFEGNESNVDFQIIDSENIVLINNVIN